jgi:hypothetical protein
LCNQSSEGADVGKRRIVRSLAVTAAAVPLALTLGAGPGHAQTSGDGLSLSVETSVEASVTVTGSSFRVNSQNVSSFNVNSQNVAVSFDMLYSTSTQTEGSSGD